MTFSCDYGYKVYVPIVLNRDEFLEAPKMMTKKHQENVITVLKHYGEKWKIENGKLLISDKIDTEILWNYTSKANNPIWLRENKTK
ncbi:hypothetical protein FLACHUCJ7_04512 [Flavobacterium chungangense]|uniref:Uncharacterized protein n=2 Tax=Flavobacterium chungangense TaxID=554283 RepID=A0A6V6ZG15_9FLAO|nr:hypothetical protein FLACHUCJ7_04512 [Flavobacterium chungangense]